MKEFYSYRIRNVESLDNDNWIQQRFDLYFDLLLDRLDLYI